MEQVLEVLQLLLSVGVYTLIAFSCGWLYAQGDVNYWRDIVYSYECQKTREAFK